MTAHGVSIYVLVALGVFLVLEFLYKRWSGKKIPSWVTLPWIAAYALMAGIWLSEREWFTVGLFLALAGWMTYSYFLARKREKKKEESWKEMFR